MAFRGGVCECVCVSHSFSSFFDSLVFFLFFFYSFLLADFYGISRFEDTGLKILWINRSNVLYRHSREIYLCDDDDAELQWKTTLFSPRFVIWSKKKRKRKLFQKREKKTEIKNRKERKNEMNKRNARKSEIEFRCFQFTLTSRANRKLERKTKPSETMYFPGYVCISIFLDAKKSPISLVWRKPFSFSRSISFSLVFLAAVAVIAKPPRERNAIAQLKQCIPFRCQLKSVGCCIRIDE